MDEKFFKPLHRHFHATAAHASHCLSVHAAHQHYIKVCALLKNELRQIATLLCFTSEARNKSIHTLTPFNGISIRHGLDP